MKRTEPAMTLGGRRLRLAPRLISASLGRGTRRRSTNGPFDLAELWPRRDTEGARA